MTNHVNHYAEHAAPVPFDRQSRTELLVSKARVEARIRATKFDLVDAQRAGNREEVDRLRLRLSKLKSAAVAAATELAVRNAARRDFIEEARRRLPADTFASILDAVAA